MTKEDYIDSLKQYEEIADCELFFLWLEESPSFMELDEIEIQINFMMYTLSAISFAKGMKTW